MEAPNTPEMPKDGEVLKEVQGGCCAKFGNVVAKNVQPKTTEDLAGYKFECDPEHSNKEGIKGCGMSVIISVKEVADRKIPLDIYVGSEMEKSYHKDLGSPHHPR